MAKKSRWSLKGILKEVVIFGLLLLGISTALNYWRAPKLDSDTLPTIQETLIDGSSFDSTLLKGKPLLINFWGTWCPICDQEASNIEAVSKKFNVLTIAVNSNSNARIKKWMKDKGVSYPVLNDANGIWAAAFKVTVFPTNFIYDSRGKHKFTETGYSTTMGLMARMKLAE